MNRRAALGALGAIATVPWLPEGLLKVGERACGIDAAVVDIRYAVARMLARKMVRYRTPTFSVAADVTSLWYNQLHSLWSVRSMTLLGLTDSGVLFCLEQLAWNYGLRVTQRSPVAGGGGSDGSPLWSWVIGPVKSHRYLRSRISP
jgi:hypothetical protein